MKKIILFSLLSFATICLAQKEPSISIPLDPETKLYTYSEVIDASEKAPKEMYNNSKSWMAQKYSDSDFIVDDSLSKLVDLGSFRITSLIGAGLVKIPFNFTILYTITLGFKDGRYRYIIDNIKTSFGDSDADTPQTLETFASSYKEMEIGKKRQIKFIEDTCQILDEKMKKTIKEIKEGVIGGAIKKNDDW